MSAAHAVSSGKLIGSDAADSFPVPGSSSACRRVSAMASRMRSRSSSRVSWVAKGPESSSGSRVSSPVSSPGGVSSSAVSASDRRGRFWWRRARCGVRALEAGAHLDQVDPADLDDRAGWRVHDGEVAFVARVGEFPDPPVLEEFEDLHGGGVAHVELRVDHEARVGLVRVGDHADVGERVVPVVRPHDGDVVAARLPPFQGFLERAGHDDLAVGVDVAEHGHERGEPAFAEGLSVVHAHRLHAGLDGSFHAFVSGFAHCSCLRCSGCRCRAGWRRRRLRAPCSIG